MHEEKGTQALLTLEHKPHESEIAGAIPTDYNNFSLQGTALKGDKHIDKTWQVNLHIRSRTICGDLVVISLK